MGTSSLHFHFAHQGAVSGDNVKFGAKQLKAWAVTMAPDGEGSCLSSTQAGRVCGHTHTWVNNISHPIYTYSHMCTHTHTHVQSMQAISSERAGLKC